MDLVTYIHNNWKESKTDIGMYSRITRWFQGMTCGVIIKSFEQNATKHGKNNTLLSDLAQQGDTEVILQFQRHLESGIADWCFQQRASARNLNSIWQKVWDYDTNIAKRQIVFYEMCVLIH